MKAINIWIFIKGVENYGIPRFVVLMVDTHAINVQFSILRFLEPQLSNIHSRGNQCGDIKIL